MVDEATSHKLISVVISTLAADTFLSATLESCLASLSQEDECVVHLDACPSQPPSIKAFKDKRLKLIMTREKIGFSAGLNLAIHESKSDLIFRIDSDDRSMSGRWNVQQRQLEKVELICGLVLHKYRTRGVPLFIPHYPTALNSAEIYAILPHANPLIHPAVAFRREVFDRVGGYGIAIAEDYEFWLKAALAGVTMKRSLNYVTVYNHHPGQATADSSWVSRVTKDTHLLDLRRELNKRNLQIGISSLEFSSGNLLRTKLLEREFRELLPLSES